MQLSRGGHPEGACTPQKSRDGLSASSQKNEIRDEQFEPCEDQIEIFKMRWGKGRRADRLPVKRRRGTESPPRVSRLASAQWGRQAKGVDLQKEQRIGKVRRLLIRCQAADVPDPHSQFDGTRKNNTGLKTTGGEKRRVIGGVKGVREPNGERWPGAGVFRSSGPSSGLKGNLSENPGRGVSVALRGTWLASQGRHGHTFCRLRKTRST